MFEAFHPLDKLQLQQAYGFPPLLGRIVQSAEECRLLLVYLVRSCWIRLPYLVLLPSVEKVFVSPQRYSHL